jgi:diguanylate cyclase (GGDEF)-like protein
VATGTVSGVTGCIEDDALADGSTSAFAYDPLTGALTRETTMRALVDLARREVLAPPGAIPAETRRREDTLGIACIVVRLGALDPFTAQHGPDARDELLSLVALRVRDSVRSSDILGRTAEDELAVLCARVPGPTAALSIARAILSQLSEPMTLSSGLTLTLRPGIGVGWSQPSTAQPEHMLAKAQRAAVESASSASPEPLLSTLYAQHHGPAGSGSPPDPAAVGSPSAASGPYG